MAESGSGQTDRYDESHNRAYGVVKADVNVGYTPDECEVLITKYDDSFWLSMMNPHGPGDIIIEFDNLRYNSDVLWFEKEIQGETYTTGHIDWDIIDAGYYFGLVGEWFRDQLDLDEYRTGVKCPECGSEILNDAMVSGCENFRCDVFFEGVPDDSWEQFDANSTDTQRGDA